VATLTERPLEWAATAPVQIEGRARSAASPDAVFAVLADHEAWPQWFGGLKEVTVTGAAEGVGARRQVRIPMSTVDEVFIAWEPGRLFAFTGTEARPGFCRSLVEHCTLEPTSDGGTDITWTMCVEPASGPAGWIFRRSRSTVRKRLEAAMASLARRAEPRT
jgi:uncharacterized protein YndB with AHSA1/START domain